MRDPIRKLRASGRFAALFLLALLFVSCQTEKQTALVNDPDDKKEGQIPWNKQEKWESSSQLSGITDRR